MARIKIANNLEELNFSEKEIARTMVDDKALCIVRQGDVLRACTDTCPHAGASLSEGYVDSRGYIVCCVHNYKFSLEHGRDSMNEGYRLRTYDIFQTPEGIFVEM